MHRGDGRAVFRAARVALRDLDPLDLGDAPSDEYDDVSGRAASVLINGGTAKEAADAIADIFRTDWGVSFGWLRRRQIASRLRAADPRLKRVRFQQGPKHGWLAVHRVRHNSRGEIVEEHYADRSHYLYMASAVVIAVMAWWGQGQLSGLFRVLVFGFAMLGTFYLVVMFGWIWIASRAMKRLRTL